MRITRSAFTRNYASYDGGGLSLGQGSDMSVSSSVFADNFAEHYGGGLETSLSSDIELAWSTVTGNYAGIVGGGVALDDSVTIGGMLITGNSDGPSFNAPDCLTKNTGSISSGYNLIGAAGDGSCVLSGDGTGNQIGVEINLSQTTIAGADMPYAAPKPDSIALGAVPTNRCRRGWGQYEHLDQRSLPRPVGNACTVGAIEGSTDVIFANGLDDSYAGE